ncbi:hypothetical protein C1645_817311 [Glomus cerebriforme]|uniref:DDE Tnp4 domain-containing protein n=1 Tax=Glomus cerebriforme TaxID=658196 RepID=A0A397TIW2_9GLOM|nr:hypothetical protein C1645_817311 [Glomus cerebriforme]
MWKQIAIVLWHLANGAGIRTLEQTLGISQGLARFKNNRGLPNVIGAIDGMHIPIHFPFKNGSQFINHKGFISSIYLEL